MKISNYNFTGNDFLQVKTKLDLDDIFGTIKARFNINRMFYQVKTGVYAIGQPDANSQVLVTANYKLTFDSLRKHLHGFNIWILVLDTKGINVWCAAGKGIFGTQELINKITETNLDKIVSHKQLLLPQLGAVGVCAYKVTKKTGFKIIFGPVRASDLKSFLKNSSNISKGMRKVKFNFFDRLILIPVEFTFGYKYSILLFLSIFILSGFYGGNFSIQNLSSVGLINVSVLFAGYFSGLVFTPLALPYLCSRFFSVKGMIAGTLTSLCLFQLIFSSIAFSFVYYIASICIILSLSSFFAMNFTGSTTFTSLSGVKKEMKIFFPIQLITFLAISGSLNA